MSRIAIIVGCACALGNLWAGLALAECEDEPVQPVAESSHVVTSDESSAVEAIRRALDLQTKIDFTDVPLEDVVAYLHDYHNIPIQLDLKAMEDASIGPDTPVTRKLEGVSLRSALRLLLGALDLTYVIKDEVLLITTPAVASNTFVTKIYPVADLTSRKGAEGEDFEALMQVIRSTIAPKTWTGAKGLASVVPLPAARALVIMQTDDAQQEIDALLSGLRQVRDKQPVAPKTTAVGAAINLPVGPVGVAGAAQPTATAQSAASAKK